MYSIIYKPRDAKHTYAALKALLPPELRVDGEYQFTKNTIRSMTSANNTRRGARHFRNYTVDRELLKFSIEEQNNLLTGEVRYVAYTKFAATFVEDMPSIEYRAEAEISFQDYIRTLNQIATNRFPFRGMRLTLTDTRYNCYVELMDDHMDGIVLKYICRTIEEWTAINDNPLDFVTQYFVPKEKLTSFWTYETMVTKRGKNRKKKTKKEPQKTPLQPTSNPPLITPPAPPPPPPKIDPPTSGLYTVGTAPLRPISRRPRNDKEDD